jgi:site-specific DNA-cytosine methylase
VKVAGLFAGIGGLERGLAAAGHETSLLCEIWEPARAVLAARITLLTFACVRPKRPIIFDCRRQH